MAYEKTVVRDALHVPALYTIHYFEYYHGYRFQGEAHDFWEFLYVDRGELQITAGERSFPLRQGQLILHPPGEFHAVSSLSEQASNAMVASFSCDGDALSRLRTHVFSLDSRERGLLSGILDEARDAFAGTLSDPASQSLVRARDQGFAAEQCVRLQLELLLIGLIRRDRDAPETPPAAPRRAGEASLAPSIGAASYFSDAARYVERNLDTSLDLKTVCAVSGVSPAQLERLCRKATGMSFIQFCRARRIRRARELIREGRLNLTAIAAATGFSSIHYFSRTFKSVMGMSPSEYLKSVRSMADKPAD